MGIGRSNTELLIRLLSECKIGRSAILQLGKQDILEPEKIEAILQKYNFQADFYKSASNDVKYFKSLGFNQVHSLDFSDFEGANIIHDLNIPIKDGLTNSYDLIFDGGTLEHIFNLPEALKNIFLLLKTGGFIVHNLPSHNHVDHGFYMFSPT